MANSKSINRRQFLSALEAIGAMAAFSGVNWRALANETAATSAPKKVDALEKEPVITIAHCCDPQLGFGPIDDPEEAYQADLEKLRKEIVNLNKVKPDLVFFAGDMTNRVKEIERDWPDVLPTIDAPIIVAPGNHDVVEPVTSEKVEAFCKVFKKEYDSTIVKGWKIITINSQYCRENDKGETVDLYDAQVKWFARELEDAQEKKLPVIVGSHIPPFVKTLDEKDEYFNFPQELRTAYLDYLIANNVRFYLAGHTHTTLERAYENMPILNGETTSRNFDQRPYGFRLLKIDADLNYEWNFVGNDA